MASGSPSSMSILLMARRAGTLYASAVARKRSMKVVDTAGWASVTTSTARSTLAAMMWLSLLRLEARRMM